MNAAIPPFAGIECSFPNNADAQSRKNTLSKTKSEKRGMTEYGAVSHKKKHESSLPSPSLGQTCTWLSKPKAKIREKQKKSENFGMAHGGKRQRPREKEQSLTMEKFFNAHFDIKSNRPCKHTIRKSMIQVCEDLASSSSSSSIAVDDMHQSKVGSNGLPVFSNEYSSNIRDKLAYQAKIKLPPHKRSHDTSPDWPKRLPDQDKQQVKHKSPHSRQDRDAEWKHVATASPQGEASKKKRRMTTTQDEDEEGAMARSSPGATLSTSKDVRKRKILVTDRDMGQTKLALSSKLKDTNLALDKIKPQCQNNVDDPAASSKQAESPKPEKKVQPHSAGNSVSASAGAGISKLQPAESRPHKRPLGHVRPANQQPGTGAVHKDDSITNGGASAQSTGLSSDSHAFEKAKRETGKQDVHFGDSSVDMECDDEAGRSGEDEPDDDDDVNHGVDDDAPVDDSDMGLPAPETHSVTAVEDGTMSHRHGPQLQQPQRPHGQSVAVNAAETAKQRGRNFDEAQLLSQGERDDSATWPPAPGMKNSVEVREQGVCPKSS